MSFFQVSAAGCRSPPPAKSRAVKNKTLRIDFFRTMAFRHAQLVFAKFSRSCGNKYSPERMKTFAKVVGRSTHKSLQYYNADNMFKIKKRIMKNKSTKINTLDQLMQLIRKETVNLCVRFAPRLNLKKSISPLPNGTFMVTFLGERTVYTKERLLAPDGPVYNDIKSRRLWTEI